MTANQLRRGIIGATMAVIGVSLPGCTAEYEARVLGDIYIGWCASMSSSGTPRTSFHLLQGDPVTGMSVRIADVVKYGVGGHVVYGLTRAGWFTFREGEVRQYSSEESWVDALSRYGIDAPSVRLPPSRLAVYAQTSWFLPLTFVATGAITGLVLLRWKRRGQVPLAHRTH